MPKAPEKSKRRFPQVTFLEYIIEQQLGPPVSRSNRSSWHCPFHADEHPSFSTLPHKPEYKDRWICFGCGLRGDEFDFLKSYFPGDDYNNRLQRVAALRVEYEKQGAGKPEGVCLPGSIVVSDRTPVYLESESPDGCHNFLRCPPLPKDLEIAFSDLSTLAATEDESPLPPCANNPKMRLCRLLGLAAALAWDQGVSLDDLASRCAREVVKATARARKQ